MFLGLRSAQGRAETVKSALFWPRHGQTLLSYDLYAQRTRAQRVLTRMKRPSLAGTPGPCRSSSHGSGGSDVPDHERLISAIGLSHLPDDPAAYCTVHRGEPTAITRGDEMLRRTKIRMAAVHNKEPGLVGQCETASSCDGLTQEDDG